MKRYRKKSAKYFRETLLQIESGFWLAAGFALFHFVIALFN